MKCNREGRLLAYDHEVDSPHIPRNADDSVAQVVCTSMAFLATTLIVIGQLVSERNYWGATFLGSILALTNFWMTKHHYHRVRKEETRLRKNLPKSKRKYRHRRSRQHRHYSSPSSKEFEVLESAAINKQNRKKARRRYTPLVPDASGIRAGDRHKGKSTRNDVDRGPSTSRRIGRSHAYYLSSASVSVSSNSRERMRVSKKRRRMRKSLLRRNLSSYGFRV